MAHPILLVRSMQTSMVDQLLAAPAMTAPEQMATTLVSTLIAHRLVVLLETVAGSKEEFEMLLLILIILLILWAGGSYAPFSPVRGNNAVHILLVIILALVLLHFLGGPRWSLY